MKIKLTHTAGTQFRGLPEAQTKRMVEGLKAAFTGGLPVDPILQLPGADGDIRAHELNRFDPIAVYRVNPSPGDVDVVVILVLIDHAMVEEFDPSPQLPQLWGAAAVGRELLRQLHGAFGRAARREPHALG
jgi:hypothetical protein